MKKYLLPLFCLVLSTQIQALEVPSRSKQDYRVQYVSYDSSDVTRINAANGYITTIIFQEGENVTNYGSGYSTAWEFSTANNYFFLKPKDKDGTTNLVVVTNRRVYNFDVHLVNKPTNATYKLTFKYPRDEIQHRIDQGRKAHLEALLKKSDPNTVKASKYANYDYSMNFGKSDNSKLLAPIEVFDNGRFTYFKFKENTDFPAVYSINTDGESIINSHVDKDYLIVHGVYSEYRLRAGLDVVGIYNQNFTGGANNTATGTTVDNLYRSVE